MRRARWVAAATAAALIGGCGASTIPDEDADTHTSAPAAATTYSNFPSPPGTGTETVPLPGTGRPPVLLGDMNTPEQFVLGAMYQQALAAQGYEVELSRNIGTTAVSQSAIRQGSLDIYPQYLSVYLSSVVKTNRRFPTLHAAYTTAQAFAHRRGMTLLEPTPFSDTTGIAVSRRYAEAHRLSAISQLAAVQSGLILGSPIEFDIDGLPKLEAAYGFKPALTATMNIGEQYGAMRANYIDGAYVQTTDGELANHAFVTLTDDKRFYGYGNVAPVVSTKVLKAEGPVFAQTIDRVNALLTTKVMRGLNAEMGLSSLDPEAIAGEVARDFLQAYGVVPPPGWSTVSSTTTTPGGCGLTTPCTSTTITGTGTVISTATTTAVTTTTATTTATATTTTSGVG